jgi:protoheme IX farnesyltransferase
LQAEKIALKRISPFIQFTKFRLSFLVVISALSGYLFVGGGNAAIIVKLLLGGFLITAASNGVNQLLEMKQDALMNRTKNRPLVTGVLSVRNGILISIACLISGAVLLGSINQNSLFLGLGAFISYAFIYTPLKGKSSWAVFVGAFPGAIPPMLGAIAHTETFSFIPGLLFFIQFMLQFPLCWAMAWVTNEDYQPAGYFLLPSKTGKSKQSAYLISLYSLVLIPISLIPWLMGITNHVSLFIVGIVGVWFYFLSYRLYTTCEDRDAKKLMFASFVYLPIIQFAYVFTKQDSVIQNLISHGLF